MYKVINLLISDVLFSDVYFLMFFIGDKRSYNYVVGLSSATMPNWNDMIFLAKLIPRILHNINRVCFIFGPPVQYQITDVTHTFLSKFVLGQVRQADDIVNNILHDAKLLRSISQMPVVLIPLHFDRDPVDRKPSAQRSVVLRPFVTNDFMTGVPVIPGSDKLPMPVSSSSSGTEMFLLIQKLYLSRFLNRWSLKFNKRLLEFLVSFTI